MELFFFFFNNIVYIVYTLYTSWNGTPLNRISLNGDSSCEYQALETFLLFLQVLPPIHFPSCCSTLSPRSFSSMNEGGQWTVQALGALGVLSFSVPLGYCGYTYRLALRTQEYLSPKGLNSQEFLS